jgi:hypothetical protein
VVTHAQNSVILEDVPLALNSFNLDVFVVQHRKWYVVANFISVRSASLDEQGVLCSFSVAARTSTFRVGVCVARCWNV